MARRLEGGPGPLVATAESDLAWVTAVARQWLAGAVTLPQTGAGSGTPVYPPAADPNNPSAYAFLYTRDFEYLLTSLLLRRESESLHTCMIRARMTGIYRTVRLYSNYPLTDLLAGTGMF